MTIDHMSCTDALTCPTPTYAPSDIHILQGCNTLHTLTHDLGGSQESTGVPDAIQVSEATWRALGGDAVLWPDPRWRSRGGVQAKGKGVLMTYVWAEEVEHARGWGGFA